MFTSKLESQPLERFIDWLKGLRIDGNQLECIY